MDTLTVQRETVEMKISISFDILTRAVSIQGCDANPLVALGMLDYALARVRRILAMCDMEQEMRERSRISLPGGPLS
jgi:hypothetical protein